MGSLAVAAKLTQVRHYYHPFATSFMRHPSIWYRLVRPAARLCALHSGPAKFHFETPSNYQRPHLASQKRKSQSA